jgi:hypothetical protein
MARRARAGIETQRRFVEIRLKYSAEEITPCLGFSSFPLTENFTNPRAGTPVAQA